MTDAIKGGKHTNHRSIIQLMKTKQLMKVL